jgi:hypothetical protein
MITLLTTLMSFLAGGLPKLMAFFQSKADNAHELAMAAMQKEKELALAAQGFLAQQKVEEIKIEQVRMQTEQVAMQTSAAMQAAALTHDIEIGKGASTWMINLRASVRPVVTYIFVADLVFAGVAGFCYGVQTNVPLDILLTKIFSEDEMQILSSIIAFWFGTQAFQKK